MNGPTKLRALLALAMTGLLASCGGGGTTTTTTTEETTGQETQIAEAPREREAPPASAPPRDVHLPPIARSTTTQGLELNTVTTSGLPVVYLRLHIRSGLASDPAEMPGLSLLVARMLKEGTRTRTSEQFAEQLEFYGADVDVSADQMQVVINVRGLAEHLEPLMALLADMVTAPRFDEQELRRLKQRELDRLTVQYGDPSQLARREFYRIAYGAHPYAHVDATAAGIERIRRADLQAWHRAHVVPNNSFLVVAGSVTGEQVTAAAERAFRTWRRRDVPALAYPELAPRTAREVVVVSRPGSVQSVICVGNLAIARSHPDWVSLTVANQVLGGSPAARLFMDLRERRSLTYGAYSSVDDLAEPGPFRARAAVPNDRTVPAMDAFMEHLTRIVGEEVPTEELGHAEQFLSDSFPLYIDTPARLAWMVAELRTFGLPDDYWDGYRSQIRAVTSAEALRAAQAHIHPDTAIVVVVGDASVVAEPLRRWGPVRVIDDTGREVASFPAAESATPTAQ